VGVPRRGCQAWGAITRAVWRAPGSRSECVAVTSRALAPSLLLGAFALAVSGASAPRVAVATIAPLADLTARVAGPGWSVRVIIPPGRSPHVFEPTPRDVKRIAPAEVVVVVGAGYDAWTADLVRACASRAVVHDAGKSVGVETAGDADHSHESHGELGHDPHWWLSPELAGRALAPLAERLAGIDPAGTAGYRARAAEAHRALIELDRRLASMLAPVRGRAFVSAHEAWAYFADRYGLRPVGSIEPVPGREPSPWDLLTLIHSARKEGIRTLFTEPQFPESSARVVAAEAGIAVRELDPIGGIPGRDSYEELLLYNATQLRDGLAAVGRS
jgi:ABC-type Zn uptake system ZnuABC Zn-binding protein ZnuA